MGDDIYHQGNSVWSTGSFRNKHSHLGWFMVVVIVPVALVTAIEVTALDLRLFQRVR